MQQHFSGISNGAKGGKKNGAAPILVAKRGGKRASSLLGWKRGN